MQDIQKDLLGFVRSSKANLLIVSCEAEDSVLLLKSIDAFEQDPEIFDIFLTFGHPFADTDDYVNQILASVEAQVLQVNEELAKRGDPPLMPFPEELKDESVLPRLKLAATLKHVREIVPKERTVAWIIYPAEIGEPRKYLEFIDYFRTQLDDAILKGTNLIAWDSVLTPVLVPKLEDQPKIKVYRPELDSASLERKLSEKANDPRVPPEEQAQLHMMLAGSDVSNQRYDQALARNQELLGYFSHTGQKHNESIILNNIGDIHYLRSNLSLAQAWYEKAIALSVELKSQPLVLYQSMNLGHSLFLQNKFNEALVYYGAAEQLAQASSAPIQQIEALERIGITKYQAVELKEAAQAWEKAVEISKKLEYKPGQKANLEHLRQLYSETGEGHRLKECEIALSEL